MMNKNILYRPHDADLHEALALLALGAALSILLVILGPLLSFGLVVALVVGVIFGNLDLWTEANRVYRIVPFFILLLLLFFWNVVYSFVLERRSARQLQASFSQYVPPELAKQIQQSNTVLNTQGESREMSILFSDVRNFTQISESYSPQELTGLMNRMLTGLSLAIHRHHGTVDKYIGDAVMALWNAPMEDPKHAANAIGAALEMQKFMRELSAEVQKQGYPELIMGVGISTGVVRVGNMGSQLRMAYTAMGDVVNLASRIEGLTKRYGVDALVTESTMRACEGEKMIFRPVDMVQVKGKQEHVRIYQPLGKEQFIEPMVWDDLKLYNRMFSAYFKGNFADALMHNNIYLEKFDNQLGRLYQDRINYYLQNPPEKWDGITRYVEK